MIFSGQGNPFKIIFKSKKTYTNKKKQQQQQHRTKTKTNTSKIVKKKEFLTCFTLGGALNSVLNCLKS